MNMFKPTKATTIQEYLDAMPAERRQQVEMLKACIEKTVPSLQPYFANNMIGFGSFPYINAKKENIEWPVIALASQKQYISVYVCALDNGEYIAEKNKDDLGKVEVGKSCIRLKKYEDVNMDTFKKILKAAAKNPGLLSAAMKKKI